MARFAIAAALVALGLSVGAAADDQQYAYLSGVYWFDGELYHVDVTCWNVPGNPEGGLAMSFKADPGGSLAESAPEGWHWSLDAHTFRAVTFDMQYMIPPGESLGGFKFAADYDPGERVYTYHISMNEGPGNWGWFTPEHIPEPWLAGPLFLAAVAASQLLWRGRGE